MNTTITNWVCYDAECAFCVRWAKRLGTWLDKKDFAVLPLQSDAVRTALNVPEAELLKEMRVITRGGAVIGGADALIYLSEFICRPLFLLTRVPGVTPVLRAGYRFAARNRNCDGVCNLKRTGGTPVPLWLPLLVLVPAAAVFGKTFPAWIYMWMLAVAMFVGCKWLCFRRATYAPAGAVKKVGFLFGWIGMDAAGFLAKREGVAKTAPGEWAFAGLKLFMGTVLLWTIARMALPAYPLVAGWAGMIGLVFILHFGLFHLLALAWRAVGVPVPLLMRAPLLSRSLGEFWGRRWNTAFNHLTTTFLFHPLRRVVDLRVATMLVFLVSGLVHELAITIPARGGYGLPTFYFLLQGVGVLFEHTKAARRFGIGRGFRGWLFMFVITAGPAFWLFPPPFIHNVILPMLRALGAT